MQKTVSENEVRCQLLHERKMRCSSGSLLCSVLVSIQAFNNNSRTNYRDCDLREQCLHHPVLLPHSFHAVTCTHLLPAYLPEQKVKVTNMKVNGSCLKLSALGSGNPCHGHSGL